MHACQRVAERKPTDPTLDYAGTWRDPVRLGTDADRVSVSASRLICSVCRGTSSASYSSCSKLSGNSGGYPRGTGTPHTATGPFVLQRRGSWDVERLTARPLADPYFAFAA